MDDVLLDLRDTIAQCVMGNPYKVADDILADLRAAGYTIIAPDGQPIETVSAIHAS